MSKQRQENDQQEAMPTMPDEACDIGDEQCPAGIKKTDKTEWSYSADKRIDRKISDRLKDFMNGL
jgi:hypothetical protein